jgi:Ca2+-transporting ATPase
VAAVHWAGQRADWSDDALRLAGLTSIVVANIAMLVGFRTGFAVVQRPNAAFDALLLGVCAFYGVILLSPPVALAFGFPSGLDVRWIVAALALPAGWAAWRFFSRRERRSPGIESESPDASSG